MKQYVIRRLYGDKIYDSKLYSTRRGVKQVLRNRYINPAIKQITVLEYDLVLNREVLGDQFMSEKNPVEVYIMFNRDDMEETEYYVGLNDVDIMERSITHFMNKYGVERKQIAWNKRNALNL